MRPTGRAHPVGRVPERIRQDFASPVAAVVIASFLWMLGHDQLGLLSAALRHQEDAVTLLSSSPDQSWHLAGYSVECVRKACLTNDTFRKALAHEQGTDADRLLEIVLSIDEHAQRYGTSGWALPGSFLAAWKPEHRYDQTGQHSSDAPRLVAETSALHDRTLTAIWLAVPFDPTEL